MRIHRSFMLAAILVLAGAGCTADLSGQGSGSTSEDGAAMEAETGASMDGEGSTDAESGAGLEAGIDVEVGAEADAPSTVTVTYDSAGFSPAALTVGRGTTVIFRNEGSSGMWVASDVHPTHAQYDGTTLSEHCASGSSFDACTAVSAGESFSFTFDRVGTWTYHNHLRATHTGAVTVTP